MIQSVKFVSVLCLKEDEKAVLRALQKSREMMICDTESSESNPSAKAEDMRRIEGLRESIKPYAPKKSLFNEAPSVTEAQFDNISEEEKASAEEIERLLSEMAESSSSIDKLKETRSRLTPWYNLASPLESLTDSAYVSFIPGIIPASSLEAFKASCEENGASAELVGTEKQNAYIVLAVMKDTSSAWLSGTGFEKAVLPQLKGKPKDICDKLDKEISEKQPLIEQAKAKLSEKLSSDISADLLYEQYKAEIERDTAPVTKTDSTVIIEGWVPADRAEKIEEAVKKATSVYDIELRNPAEGETPPTVLRNKKIVSKFEGITNMFSMPKYGGIDPNPVMAPWYWIIFGLMMGDAGYGAMMLIFCLGFRALMKPKGGMKDLCDVILYSSVTSIIAGVVFGSYFGASLLPPLWFSTISFDGSNSDGPIKMLLFTLVVGVLHIFTGLIVKAYYEIKAGDVKTAFCDDFSWLLVLTGISVYAVGMAMENILQTIGMFVAIAGALIVLCTAGREKPNLFGKVTGGLLGLYGITSYMSDILSYSRILALGLSTGVVGWVMNLLAGMVADSIPVVGWVFAIVIYIIGHIFNLALGLLSAYVHDSRLQYIEFYGKFYEGNGRLFKPFAVETKTINIKNNSEEN